MTISACQGTPEVWILLQSVTVEDFGSREGVIGRAETRPAARDCPFRLWRLKAFYALKESYHGRIRLGVHAKIANSGRSIHRQIGPVRTSMSPAEKRYC